MADFNKAMNVVLANEGGYVDSPNDPGGETNFGISKRAYPTLDIKSLTVDDAKGIYQRDYWHFDGVIDDDTATKLMDMTVNMGFGRATQLTQLALQQLGKSIQADGKWGPLTLSQINSCTPGEILPEIRTEQSHFYVDRVAKDPSQYPFLKGWLRRVQSC